MTIALAYPAEGGTFDALGHYRPDPKAVVFMDFSAAIDPKADYFVPSDNPADCSKPGFTQVPATDALAGDSVLHIQTNAIKGCAERFVVRGVPERKASYRATLWTRHGGLDAQINANYKPESGRAAEYAKLAPTGRTTSDGWVELASNDFPIDGTQLATFYLKVYDFDSVGADIDALEIVESGVYVEPKSCSGVGAGVCGPEALCLHGSCQQGRLFVPPLPDPAVRDEVVDRMAGLLQNFFGGRKTRLSDLPEALARIEGLRSAVTPWQFWNGFGSAIRRLHDWHTRANASIGNGAGTRRLNVCFIAGHADSSQLQWPRHPSYDDVLVSHTASDGTAGLKTGDRLVAVDGMHPIAWAQTLREIDWGWWQACDDRVFTEPLERMRDLIAAYANSFTFLPCDKTTKTCGPAKTVKISELAAANGWVACDNRPFYYLDAGNPSANHWVGWNFHRGRVVGTTEGEKIYSLIWDTLYGGGDPNGHVNGNLKTAFSFFKQNARGVILDHRAGSGGTLDGAETATQLMRAPATVLVFRSPIDVAGSNGPATPAEGKALFDAAKSSSPYEVGSAGYDPDLPVALLLHRDGSASDFFPFGVKGAPKVRIFAPGPTAGAFSSFYTLSPWGPVHFQIASGDSISMTGEPLIGHGVEPDEVVLQRQSDLLSGKDTMVETALAWLRKGLKP
jgi:hypothetical protein